MIRPPVPVMPGPVSRLTGMIEEVEMRASPVPAVVMNSRAEMLGLAPKLSVPPWKVTDESAAPRLLSANTVSTPSLIVVPPE